MRTERLAKGTVEQPPAWRLARRWVTASTERERVRVERWLNVRGPKHRSNEVKQSVQIGTRVRSTGYSNVWATHSLPGRYSSSVA